MLLISVKKFIIPRIVHKQIENSKTNASLAILYTICSKLSFGFVENSFNYIKK